MQKMILQDSEKNDIHVYLYEPEKKPFKGVVQIIHGASDHFARFGLFAEFLNKSGFIAIGSDLLGHGLSTKTYDYVHFADKSGSELALESVTLVKDYISQNYPNLPVYLFGHSMGSFLSEVMILRYPNFYKKTVLSGDTLMPALLLNGGLLMCDIIKAFKGPTYVSKLANSLGMGAYPVKMRKAGIMGKDDLDEGWLTKNLEIQQYYHDSHMCGQPFTISAYQDLLSWVKYISSVKNLKKGNLEMPIYFVSGANDPISDLGKDLVKLVERFKKVGYKNIFYKLYENDRHEILNELDNQTVYTDILQFIKK